MYLKAEKICKQYNNKQIIQNIEFDIEKGDIVSFIGRSGSGKTTIFNILAGFETPDKGDIFINNKNITNMKKDISYMTQKHLLLPYLNVIDNVCLNFFIKNINKKDAYNMAEPMLEKFGLFEYKNKYPSELSGGMKQRVSFLRAYLKDANIMLFDEPFSALDNITKQGLYKWFINMIKYKNKTAMLITHDINEAICLSDKIFVLSGKPSNIVLKISISNDIKKEKDFIYSTRYSKYYKEIMTAL